MTRDLGKVERYNIYIGLNDREKLEQICSTETFKAVVKGVCQDYCVAFSMTEQMGGYMMADGTFITENSLVLSLSGLNNEQALSLAEELRHLLNQEAVMVTRETPEMYLLTDRDVNI